VEDTTNLARQGNGAESRAASAASAANAPPQVAKASLPAAGPSKAGAIAAASARQLAVHGGGQPEDRASGGQSPQATDLSTAMP
jgi:hypothetical protein